MGSNMYVDEYEAYRLNGESVKDTGFRLGALEYQILKLLAESGLRQFTPSEIWKTLKVDRRRVHQALVYLLRRGIVARIARGLYRLLLDPWELLKAAIVQGPNARSVKDNHDTRVGAAVRGAAKYVDGVGLYFDNVRGYDDGGRVPGDRGRVLSRGDLVRFVKISYAEVGVATGTRLFDGLGSVTIYFGCKDNGPHTICSDWVEWRPPSGFYSKHGIVEAVNVYRSKVLPYAFGLAARAASVVRAPAEKFRSSLYGLARSLYLVLRPSSSSSGSSNSCRAPAVEVNGDGSFTVCFNCPPTLYRRLIYSARAARRDWNSIIVEVLSGVLP